MLHQIAKLIKLDKPLVIFDTETTGLFFSHDRIIELAYLKIMPKGQIFKADIFLNPEMPISAEATAVHGITDEQVEDKPTFRDKAQEIWEIFLGSDYGGFNVINFDLPILKREFLRVGMDFDFNQSKIIDSKTIYHYMEPRTLSAAYQFYCGKEHEDAHSAMADVKAVTEILAKQLEKYDEIRDWEFLYKIHRAAGDRFVDNEKKFYWRNGEAYFAFSAKYRDVPLALVAEKDPDFLRWIISADFSDETKNIVRKALDGEMPKKQ